MPIFACPNCNSIENTALCRHGFWRLRGFVPLCSSCDPVVGVWHGEFQRVDASAADQGSLYRFGVLGDRVFDFADYLAVLAAEPGDVDRRADPDPDPCVGTPSVDSRGGGLARLRP